MLSVHLRTVIPAIVLLPLLCHPLSLFSSSPRPLKATCDLHMSEEPLRSLVDSFVLVLDETSHPPSSYSIQCIARLHHIQFLYSLGGAGAAALSALTDDRYLETGCYLELTGKLTVQDSTNAVAHIRIQPSLKPDDDSMHFRHLQYILACVMLQRILYRYSSYNDRPIDKVLFYAHDHETCDTCQVFTFNQLMMEGGFPQLFASLLGTATPNDGSSNNDNNNIEMSNMVDASGNFLAYIPRLLIHKFNILHDGVGILVWKQSDLKSTMYNSDVYVHKRTRTKRIFPSLYDMFVGGICTANEPVKLTAARELEEELNLKHSNEFLSNPLFSCIICTDYNRCFVHLFSYSYHQQHDNIQWQQEEVEWGDFVSYSIIEEAAWASIQRLKERGTWPGFDEKQQRIDTNRYRNSPASTWDFVPDGLLVWEAWQDYVNSCKIEIL